MSNVKNVNEVAKKVEKEVGDVSIIINNAGIMPTRLIEDYSDEEIERIFKINVFAHFWVGIPPRITSTTMVVLNFADNPSLPPKNEREQPWPHSGPLVLRGSHRFQEPDPLLLLKICSARSHGIFARGDPGRPEI